MTGRVAQMGRGVMQDVAERRMIDQMAQEHRGVADRRCAGRAGATPSRRDQCWAPSSPIVRSASSVRASSGPLAALAGYALLSVALFGRGVLREGGGSVVGSYGADQASFVWSLAWWPHAIANGVHPLLIDLVYAPDGWNMAWTSADPGPGDPGLAARRPPSARSRPTTSWRSRRPRWRPGARSCCAATSARAPGRRLPAGSSSASAPTRPRETLNHLNLATRLHAPADRARVRPLPARRPLRSLVRRPARALRARHLRDIPRDALLGHAGRRIRARRRPRVHARDGAGATLPLPAAGLPRVCHRARGRLSVPVGGAGAPRSARHQRAGSTSSTSPT